MTPQLAPPAPGTPTPVWVFYITILCVFGVLVVVAWIRRILAARADAVPAPPAPEPVSEQFDEPLAPPRPCEVCDIAPAVMPRPMIVQSRWDRSQRRKLHQQPPMYDVKDDVESGPRLCVPDHRALQRRKEQFLAQKRMAQADLNAKMEAEIAAFEGGIALALQREERMLANERFQQVIEGRNPSRQLPAEASPSSTGVHTVTISPEKPEQDP